MSSASQKSKSGSNPGKLVLRIVLFAGLGVAVVLAVVDFIAKKGAENTAEAWGAALKSAEKDGKDLTQKDLDKLKQGSPKVADDTAGPGQTAKVFTWNRILGDDLPIKVTYDKAVTPSVAIIEPQW